MDWREIRSIQSIMRIGISLFQFYKDRIGGVEDYVINLIRYSLPHLSSEEELILFGTRTNLEYFQKLNHRRVRLVEFQYSDLYIKLLRLFNALGMPFLLSGLMRKIKDLSPDVFLLPQQDYFLAEPDFPVVATFVDLQHRHFPGNFSGWRRIIRNRNDRRCVQKADGLIAVSNTTRTDVIRILGASPEQIRTIYVGAGKQLKVDESNCTPLIEGDYFFYPANSYPHKNHLFLIDAFHCFLEKNPHVKCKLVMTGRIFPENRQGIQNRLDHRILHLGYVTADRLSNLYKHCAALVFPSAFEGFGFPLIEAMHFVKPILCSDLPVFTELAGDAVCYFNRNNRDDLIEKLKMISATGHDSTELKKTYKPIIDKFTWDRCALSTLDWLRKIESQPIASHR
jgi:glycosyltransferase involved in cell wall biosynthesis